MIVTAIAIPTFLFSLLAIARLMKVSARTALIFTALNAAIGLSFFSALTVIPQLSPQTLYTLSAEKMIAAAPIIFMFELLSGTYLASRILRLNFIRFFKLTVAALLLTSAILVPLFLLAFLF